MKKDYRFLSNNELINCVVNDSRISANSLIGIELDTLIEQLTPARQQFAIAIIELYKRSLQTVNDRKQIRSSTDIFNIMCPLLTDLQVEEFWFMALNQSGKVIRKSRISIGGLAATYVDIRVLVKELLKVNATQCVVLHNHPSGYMQPSQEDKALTEKIKKALDILNIRLIDHVIIGQNKYYSFSDEGLI